MKGSAGVLALVMIETTVGGLVLLWSTALWRRVKRGFFKLTGSVLLATAVAAAASATAATDAGAPVAARVAVWGAWGVAALVALWLAFTFTYLFRPAHALGVTSAVAGVASLGAFAANAEAGPVVAFLQLAAGAAFMGAVVDGLLLGHWYLVDRGLSRGPINRLALLLQIGVGLELVGVLADGLGEPADVEAFSPLLTATGFASYIALGMVIATGLIAFMVAATLRGTRASAVQSATGFFYLAVITAFSAEVAAKVGFLS